MITAAGASTDLAYIAGFEHTTVSIGDVAPQPYVLRSTTIFRREDGEWKAVHRHGDPMPNSESRPDQLSNFGEEPHAR